MKEIRVVGQSAGKRELLSKTSPHTGRMFAHQDSLPHIPVPPLEQTLSRYLETQQPLLDAEEYDKTEQIVKDFQKKDGPKLQALLENRANSTTSWLSDWWLNTAYLTYREPVLINISPGLTFPLEHFKTKEDQLRYAAKLVAGIMDYKIQIDEQSLPVEYMGKDPLCMTQYYKILSSCRVPGVKHDAVVCYPPNEPDPPRHIVVVHNNYFFRVDVYGHDWKPLNMEQLYDQLKHVVDMSHKKCIPLGILTTENRNTWGKMYKKLCKDNANKRSLEEIHRSIFMLCLDDVITYNGKDRLTAVMEQVLHGGGSNSNTGNRWYDKTLQFVVGADGGCGLTYEHSPAEGPPVAHLMDHAMQYIDNNQETRLPAAGIHEPVKLKFRLSDDVQDAITFASSNADALINDTQTTALVFDNFGKNFIKSQKLSPDAFVQMCLQLAFYRMHGCTSATYETGSTRKFKLGRTDTIRSCSNESYTFSRLMDDGKATSRDRAEALRTAIARHRTYTSWTINGEAVDRHLLGLKLQAIESGMNVPDLYMDPAYSSWLQFRISTSQVPAKCDATMVFGPAVPNGYGFCYNPKDNQINLSITAYNTSPDTDSDAMAQVIKQAFIDMQNVLVATAKAKL